MSSTTTSTIEKMWSLNEVSARPNRLFNAKRIRFDRGAKCGIDYLRSIVTRSFTLC